MFVQCSLFYFLFLFEFGSLDTYDEYEYGNNNYYDWYKEENEHTSTTLLPTTAPPTTTTTTFPTTVRRLTTSTQLATTADDYNILYQEYVDSFTKEFIRDESKLIDTSPYYSTRFNAPWLGIVSSTQTVTTTTTRSRDDITTSANTERTLGVNGVDRPTSIIIITILGVLAIFSILCITAVATQRYGGKESLNALWMNAVATITCRNSTVYNEEAVNEMNNETKVVNEMNNETKIDTVIEANNEIAYQNERAAKTNEAAIEISIETEQQNKQATKTDNAAIEINNETELKNEENLKSDNATAEITDETANHNESCDAIEMYNEKAQRKNVLT